MSRSAFTGFRFSAEVIAAAVRWYLRYGLSYPGVKALLADWGVEVDHVANLPSVIITGLAFRQNLRRGHYQLATECPHPLRVAAAFAELAETI